MLLGSFDSSAFSKLETRNHNRSGQNQARRAGRLAHSIGVSSPSIFCRRLVNLQMNE